MMALTWFGYLLQGVFTLAALAAAAGAFVRLKSSPSGICLGLGLGLLGLISALGPIQRAVSTFVATQEGGLADLARTQMMFDSCSHVLAALLWCLIAAGLAMLPKSLERLREKSRGRPAQF